MLTIKILYYTGLGDKTISGSVQGQIGWGYNQFGLVKDVSACGRGLEIGDL